MIYVTGDTHGDIERLKLASKMLKKNDTLIICGDFGFIWQGDKAETRLWKKLGAKKYNVLFVDGVHENFPLLEKFPMEEWCGGKTRHISGNLRYLMRGQVFLLENKRIFTFGGSGFAEDEGVPHPEHCFPSEEECAEGFTNLNEYQNTVDYIFSYEPPTRLAEFLDLPYGEKGHLNSFLDRVDKEITFTRWFFGHHHMQKMITAKYFAVFNKIIPVSMEARRKSK